MHRLGPFLQEIKMMSLILRLQAQFVNAKPKSARRKSKWAIECCESQSDAAQKEPICACVTLDRTHATRTKMRGDEWRVALITLGRRRPYFRNGNNVHKSKSSYKASETPR
jgi:hypothetical protein